MNQLQLFKEIIYVIFHMCCIVSKLKILHEDCYEMLIRYVARATLMNRCFSSLRLIGISRCYPVHFVIYYNPLIIDVNMIYLNYVDKRLTYLCDKLRTTNDGLISK